MHAQTWHVARIDENTYRLAFRARDGAVAVVVLDYSGLRRLAIALVDLLSLLPVPPGAGGVSGGTGGCPARPR